MRNDDVALRHLWKVLAVAENGGVNRAARALNISQPAVTVGIREVEVWLNILLFERSATGMRLTATGERFAERLRRASCHLDELGRQFAVTGVRWKIARRHLIAVIATADAGNFLAGGRTQGVSGAAIERSVRELEQLLNCSLFERRRNHAVATEACVAILHRGKAALTELRLAIDELKESEDRHGSRVVIGSSPNGQPLLVPRAIALLTQRLPELNIAIVDGTYQRLLPSLVSGEIDLIIGALPSFLTTVKEISREILFCEGPPSIVGRAGHPLVQKEDLTLADCVQSSWIVPPQGTAPRAHFESLFKRADLRVPKNLIECSSTVAIRTLLMETDHLALGTRIRLDLELKLGLLKVLPINLQEPPYPIGITTRADMLPTRAISTLIEILRSIGHASVESTPHRNELFRGHTPA